ncbi:hypothetical protein C451_18023 [Halococcus thailandensis JCM 13552]|uniref:Uncharacterized protein n=1 Tax=Halococcus thailandensis JCM 13552 TaxID=1227457 RepID=M0MW59_9EURY|nr:hypothetical protein C451_18023 [Halococcus thailandensis JCM 13552]
MCSLQKIVRWCGTERRYRPLRPVDSRRVVAAHAVSVGRYETLSRARRAHLPLVALMVGYTVLSLWIISRPVVS